MSSDQRSYCLALASQRQRVMFQESNDDGVQVEASSNISSEQRRQRRGESATRCSRFFKLRDFVHVLKPHTIVGCK